MKSTKPYWYSNMAFLLETHYYVSFFINLMINQTLTLALVRLVKRLRLKTRFVLSENCTTPTRVRLFSRSRRLTTALSQSLMRVNRRSPIDPDESTMNTTSALFGQSGKKGQKETLINTMNVDMNVDILLE